MVKGSEKESNSQSSVNNLHESTPISVNFQNKTVSDNQFELLLLQQHQNQKQRQQIGDDPGIDNRSSNVSHGQVIDAELRSHPAYIAYCYSNVNKNPTLPPPLLSLEEWQIFQRFQEVGDFFEDGTSSHPYNQMHHRGVASQKAEDILIEMRRTVARNLSRMDGNSLGGGLGARRKSFTDMQQGGLGKCFTPPSRLSRPASYNSLTDVINRSSSTSELENKTKSYDAEAGQSSTTKLKSSEHSRSLRPPPGFSNRSNFVSIDRDDDRVNSGSQSPELGLSNFQLDQEFNKSGVNNFMSFKDYRNLVLENEVSHGSNLVHSGQRNFPHRASSMVNLQSLANASDYLRLPDSKLSHQSNNIPKRSSSLVNLQSLANSSDSGNFIDFTDLGIKLSNAVLEVETLRRNRVLDHSNHCSTNEQHNLSHTRNAISTSYSADDLRELGKVYTEKFLSQEKQQDQQPLMYKPGHINRQYHGNPGSSSPFLNKSNQMATSSPFLNKSNQMAYIARPSSKSGGRLQKESGSRSFNASKIKEPVSPVSRNSQGKTTVEGKSLQEIKISKNKSLELSDVLNVVVGFRSEQYLSIQKKQ